MEMELTKMISKETKNNQLLSIA